MEREFIKCLKIDTKIFVVSLDEIPDIDPNLAYKVNMDPCAWYMAQRRKR